MNRSDISSIPINRYDAAGGVVVHDEKVLVLFRLGRKIDVRLPKGHIEPGESPQDAALREVHEESGYSDLLILTDLGIQLVEFERKGKHTIRSEHYFLMTLGSDQNQAQPELDRLPLWLSWDEALNRLTYEVEKDWVRRARAQFTRPAQ